MYEEFRQPDVITALAQYDALVAARFSAISDYLTANSITPTQELIDGYCLGYQRRLTRYFRGRVKDLGVYVYAELPIAFLDLNVPATLPWNTALLLTGYDGEYGYPIYDTAQRKFRDYLMFYHESLDSTKVLFPLMGTPPNGPRAKHPTAAEITAWKTLLEGQGFDWANASNVTQWRQRLASAAYTL
jgi:hypothetical protein